MENDTEHLQAKLQQARDVIATLLQDADVGEFEAQRLIDYFSRDSYDPAFQPWTREEAGLRPEELSAANDG